MPNLIDDIKAGAQEILGKDIEVEIVEQTVTATVETGLGNVEAVITFNEKVLQDAQTKPTAAAFVRSQVVSALHREIVKRALTT